MSQADLSWRVVPDGAMPILLSPTEVFAPSGGGPVIATGSRYRVVAIRDGIAEVELDAGSHATRGYCPVELVGARSFSTRGWRARIRVFGFGAAAAAVAVLLLSLM